MKGKRNWEIKREKEKKKIFRVEWLGGRQTWKERGGGKREAAKLRVHLQKAALCRNRSLKLQFRRERGS